MSSIIDVMNLQGFKETHSKYILRRGFYCPRPFFI